MNRRNTIIIALIAIICAAAIYYWGPDKNEPVASSNQGTAIYYIDSENNRLKSERITVEGETDTEIVENAFKALKSKPKSEMLISAVPEYVNYINCYIDEATAKINLSSSYYDMDKKTELYCRSALLKTLTELEFIDEVEIFVAGQTLKQTNGEPIGAVGSDDVITTASVEARPITSVKVVRLYFASSDYTAFNAEDRRIEVNRNQPIEKYVVEEIIKGPRGDKSIATVPADTKVRNVMTQDKVCYVDLSAEFVSKQNSEETTVYFAIYTIVNSLTRLDNIEKVQFLIEGEKQEDYKGFMDFSKPFEPK